LLIAVVSMSSCWAISVSAAGPSKVTRTPSSFAFSSAPVFTACQNWCWKPFETRAMYISPSLPPPAGSPSSITSPPPAQPARTSAEAATSVANADFLPNRMETPLLCDAGLVAGVVDIPVGCAGADRSAGSAEGPLGMTAGTGAPPSRISGPLPVAQRVEEHRQQHDDADDDVLPLRLDRHDPQAVDQHAHDQRADHGADDRSATAQQRGAADDHGRDGLQLVAHADLWLSRVEPGGDDHARDADER